MSYRDFYFHNQEGLKLYARDYGERTKTTPPILCLPGLTRNSKDFAALAEHLSATHRIICADLRGRGKSEYARSWTDYTPAAEASDTLALMTATGVHEAVVAGTSRGGLVAMQMALQRPTCLKAVILNDIGPEVAPEGLKRISGYAGKMEAPPSWGEAAIRLRQMNEHHFPNLTAEQWHQFAANTFKDEDGKPAMDYDPAIGTGLRRAMMLARGNIPSIWPQFHALRHVPVLVVRGENSDLLSKGTFAQMAEEHPGLQTVTARDRGHAPFLDEPEVTTAIDTFLGIIR